MVRDSFLRSVTAPQRVLLLKVFRSRLELCIGEVRFTSGQDQIHHPQL